MGELGRHKKEIGRFTAQRTLGIFSMYEKLGLEEWYDPSAYRIVYDRLKKYSPMNKSI
ncbi:hypothetical protein PcaKH15_33310 [Parageobacillus caldoxylosilyticus]|nr:hypothetical protein PcaKH15_33310 [Parageobacillus caldoxylosilyticus]BDG41216.1 hypothetical protein PcaKH16_33550 [Parageobacillus caldoxylosilyticus]BDG44971.1 hypothetical protein PcaKH35_33160 [Parageobacillus caldoxylosilyticus]